MAQYRLSVSVISRKTGRSATAAAAYRAGCEIEDQRTGERFDFSNKRGVLHSEMVLPSNAPEWAHDRAELWNRSEMADKRADATVAREIQLSLPHELTPVQRRELTLEFARSVSARYQIAVDVSIHAPNRNGDERNHHVHLLLCTRPFDGQSKTGFGNKMRDLDQAVQRIQGRGNEVERLRAEWAGQMNQALERANVQTPEGAIVQVDHRSYARQGVEKQPMVKEGPAATALKRRGEYSERAEINEEIVTRNTAREQLQEQVTKIEQELAALTYRRAGGLASAQIREELVAAASAVSADLMQSQQEEQTKSEQSKQIHHYLGDGVQQRGQDQRKEAGTPAGGVPETTMNEEEKRLIEEERLKFRMAFNDYFSEYRTQAEAFHIPREYTPQFDANDRDTKEFQQQHLDVDYVEDGKALHRRNAEECNGFEDWIQKQRQAFRQQDAAEIERQNEAYKHLSGDERKMHEQAQAWGFEVREQGRDLEQVQLQDLFRDYQQGLQFRRFEALNEQNDANLAKLDQAYEQFQRNQQPQQERDTTQEPTRREAARSGLDELNKQLGLSETDIEQNRQQRQVQREQEEEARKRNLDFTPR